LHRFSRTSGVQPGSLTSDGGLSRLVWVYDPLWTFAATTWDDRCESARIGIERVEAISVEGRIDERRILWLLPLRRSAI
jgi:hypothetical protein